MMQTNSDEETFVSNDFGYCFYDHENSLIYNLYVYKQFRGLGKSKGLINKMLSEIRRHGFNSNVRIEVKPFDGCEIPVEKLNSYYKSFGLITNE